MKTSHWLWLFALACLLTPPVSAGEQPRVQLAILLDTSNSMDGLIDQARSELWQVVNELTVAHRGGHHPKLEIALYEYGNDGLPAEGGHVRRVLTFTDDLDRVSEELFALTTNGGSEYCGKVISDAVAELAWSPSPEVLKLVFIAGNEPFSQGPVDYKKACRTAIESGVQVNTIHCGSHTTGIEVHWKDGALLADGSYLSIDHNQAVAHIAAPQDDEIARLSNELNETYVPFGAEGEEAQKRQVAQDRNAAGIASGTNAKRAKVKASSNYVNTGWDLVDATEAGEVKLEDLEPEDLPEEMRTMSDAEKKAHIEAMRNQRLEVRTNIQRLSDERDLYVAAERKKLAATGDDTLDTAMIKAIREQGGKKGLKFETTEE